MKAEKLSTAYIKNHSRILFELSTLKRRVSTYVKQPLTTPRFRCLIIILNKSCTKMFIIITVVCNFVVMTTESGE